MARAGAFDDLDAAFNYHPGTINTPTKGSCVGVNHMRFVSTGAHRMPDPNHTWDGQPWMQSN